MGVPDEDPTEHRGRHPIPPRVRAKDRAAAKPQWCRIGASRGWSQRSTGPRRSPTQTEANALENDVLSELATIFPAVTPRASVPAAVIPQMRYRTYRAVRELLERLTATKPLVLMLDDIHWADPASIELLGTLLRRPPDAAVLITLAVRPHQAPDRLSNALERAHRQGAIQRLPLGPLTREQAQDLLGDTVDDAVTEQLYNESGGNPFYLEQLARSLGRVAAADVAIAPSSSLGLDVPAAVAGALDE